MRKPDPSAEERAAAELVTHRSHVVQRMTAVWPICRPV